MVPLLSICKWNRENSQRERRKGQRSSEFSCYDCIGASLGNINIKVSLLSVFVFSTSALIFLLGSACLVLVGKPSWVQYQTLGKFWMELPHCLHFSGASMSPCRGWEVLRAWIGGPGGSERLVLWPAQVFHMLAKEPVTRQKTKFKKNNNKKTPKDSPGSRQRWSLSILLRMGTQTW